MNTAQVEQVLSSFCSDQGASTCSVSVRAGKPCLKSSGSDEASVEGSGGSSGESSGEGSGEGNGAVAGSGDSADIKGDSASGEQASGSGDGVLACDPNAKEYSVSLSVSSDSSALFSAPAWDEAALAALSSSLFRRRLLALRRRLLEVDAPEIMILDSKLESLSVSISLRDLGGPNAAVAAAAQMSGLPDLLANAIGNDGSAVFLTEFPRAVTPPLPPPQLPPSPLEPPQSPPLSPPPISPPPSPNVPPVAEILLVTDSNSLALTAAGGDAGVITGVTVGIVLAALLILAFVAYKMKCCGTLCSLSTAKLISTDKGYVVFRSTTQRGIRRHVVGQPQQSPQLASAVGKKTRKYPGGDIESKGATYKASAAKRQGLTPDRGRIVISARKKPVKRAPGGPRGPSFIVPPSFMVQDAVGF